MAQSGKFADVILPLSLRGLYTYSIPPEMSLYAEAGKRVVVSFGKSKFYTAVIASIHDRRPQAYEPKELLELIDDEPMVSGQQLRLWEWMASYYMCTLGEVMIAALPSALKIQSETAVSLAEGNDVVPEVMLTPDEEAIVDFVRNNGSAVVSDTVKKFGSANTMKVIRKLTELGVLAVHEELREPFRPRTVEYVRLGSKGNDEQFMHSVFDQLEKRSPKQLDILMHFIRLKNEKKRDWFPRSQLLKQAGASAQSLTQLVSKGILEVYSAVEDLSSIPVSETGRKVLLSEIQQAAYDKISDGFLSDKPVLIHGVTSSGKTEVYIRLIQDAIDQGRQVLYLLPEIALTTQIINRLRSHFGDRLLVYHSRFSTRDRAEVYTKVLRDGADGSYRYPIVVGARSSVFLPFSSLAMIIADEEHDGSYKQQDPAPRYNARDTAVICKSIYGCNILLGSATPALESYHNVLGDKYVLVEMKQRYGGVKMPVIQTIDLKEAHKNKQMRSFFSVEMIEAVEQALNSGEQVILFQNRRGFAPMLECQKCAWVPKCINCDVSLTLHKRSGQLRCHYCGYGQVPPSRCGGCGDPDIRMKGIGTERIEDEISVFFPDKRVERLDLDTTTSRSAYQRIISGFENGEIDILVGTQMVTKGLDFDNVSLVGVLNADNILNFPDFRSAERGYQLLSQVAGRAGRKFKRGKVLIQTYNVKHPVLQFVIENDYKGFYNYETDERSRFSYPPFFRLIRMKLRHRDEKQLIKMAEDYTRDLRNVFGTRVLGPVSPPVARVRNFYIRQVLVKVEKDFSSVKVRELLRDTTDRFVADEKHRGFFIQIDVDPQ